MCSSVKASGSATTARELQRDELEAGALAEVSEKGRPRTGLARFGRLAPLQLALADGLAGLSTSGFCGRAVHERLATLAMLSDGRQGGCGA
jgi:serine/threonine protein phosphatase PrpC